MKQVWKARINLDPQAFELVTTVHLPKGSKIIHIGSDTLARQCIWFEFDPRDKDNRVPRKFQIYGTGDVIPSMAEHVATWVHPPFVWHVYDLGELLSPLGSAEV